MNYATLEQDISPNLPHSEYISFLKNTFKRLHEDVDANFVIRRQKEKRAYDVRHHVADAPIYKIGQKVLLENRKPKGYSARVLCHRRSEQPFVIANIVERQSTFHPTEDNKYPQLNESEISCSYEITNLKTNRIWKSLVPARRLKLYYENKDFKIPFIAER